MHRQGLLLGGVSFHFWYIRVELVAPLLEYFVDIGKVQDLCACVVSGGYVHVVSCVVL